MTLRRQPDPPVGPRREAGVASAHPTVAGLGLTIWLWGPVTLYMAAIFVVSAQPEVPVPQVGLSDKSLHSLAYMGLGILMVRALAGGLDARITLRVALLGAALSAAYGCTDEIHQLFVPGRSAELRDVIADSIGAAAGALLVWLWGIISAPRHAL